MYTAAHVLSKGVAIGEHKVSATCSNRQQAIRLNYGIEQMAEEKWPEGSTGTNTYPFDLKLDGQKVMPFTIYDYRGSMLNGLSDDDVDDTESLINAFKESNCIIILIDGRTVLAALNPEEKAPFHRSDASFAQQLRARNELNFVENLIADCNTRMNRSVPILLAITKRDLFCPEELEVGKKLVKDLLPSVFSLRNDMIAGLTSVTLGENLKNDNGKLTGTLCLNTDGNVHLPILFALFQSIEDITGISDGRDVVKRLVYGLFSSDRVEFYRGGKRAHLLMD